MDNQSRLDELRLENPDDQFYYLKYENGPANSLQEIMFSQKELLIKSIDSDRDTKLGDKQKFHGVIVKKIKGDPVKEIFTILDQQPHPVGGMRSLYDFISENIKYPAQAREMGIEGKVFVEFVVGNDGKLINVKAIKGIGAGCDEEAVRVLKEAPKWIPGKVVDMPVKVKMILPISYKLSPSQKNSTKIEEVVLE